MILIFAVISVFSYGQEIIVQSTNIKDITLFSTYKNSLEILSAINKLKNVINNNPDYSKKNMKVVVKVTFYNTSSIIFPLKRIDDLLYIWGSNTGSNGNRITLNFLFKEESVGDSKKLEFDDFQYQEGGGGEQVPELVADYIKENILRPQNNDVEKIIKKGLNAVKNAFDRSFQQQMIDNAPPLFPQKKYYKGYAYFGFNWFNFKVNENQDKLLYDLETLYQKDENSNYVLLPNQSVKSLLDNQNKIFTLYNDQYLKMSETEVSTKGETIYYEETTLLDNSDPNKIYDSTKTVILSNVNTFNGWEYVGKEPRTLKYSFDNNEKSLSQQHKIKVVTGTVPAEGEVDEYNGLSSFGKRFRLNQPTWCNKFARDVTKNTYFKNNAIMIDDGASRLNSNFKANPNKYKNITDINKDIIWEKYINKGYLVIFSTKDHIELGFPDNKQYLNNRERHPDDNRYPNVSLCNQTEKIQLTIGAGATVGYKLATEWAIKINPTTGKKPDAFLYLEYLSFEN